MGQGSRWDTAVYPLVHVPNFRGVSGSEDRGGGDNSIQFIMLGRWMTKVLKNSDKKWRVGDNNILIFLCHWLDKKNATLKNCIWGNFFYSYL